MVRDDMEHLWNDDWQGISEELKRKISPYAMLPTTIPGLPWN
jgi:hypothetical protein